MTTEELKAILEAHKTWLEGKPGGKRADLRNADLRNADLSDADLGGADLRDANLRGADLRFADLSCADLSCADLRDADLRNANLRGADLRGTDLRNANLKGADLRRADLPAFQVVPETGAFEAWKSARRLDSGATVVLKLEIPADAKRVSTLVGRKCRASKAKVLAAFDHRGKRLPPNVPVRSHHDAKFSYVVGRTHSVKRMDRDIRVECTRGIHFFITRREAEEYI